MAYHSDFLEPFRLAPFYVDRILKGTPPGDLPVQMPQKFRFVVNRRTATALGIEGPSLVRLLDSLERRGLIERREDEYDRRARGIYLTQAGHDLAVRVAKVGTEIQLRMLSSVPPEDLEICQRVLAEIEQKLDEDPIEETSKRRNR